MDDEIRNEYFEWLYNSVCDKVFSKNNSFRKLLMRLHSIEFTFIIQRDANRADDGINMRRRFAINNGYEHIYDEIMEILDEPCSILEMMIALAIRCEETIMDDPIIGDRTKQWFWGMITNLGLGSMTDDQFDKNYVDSVIQTFLNREYESDGRGGLFTINNCNIDLRDVEIWYQLCWYLDSIT